MFGPALGALSTCPEGQRFWDLVMYGAQQAELGDGILHTFLEVAWGGVPLDEISLMVKIASTFISENLKCSARVETLTNLGSLDMATTRKLRSNIRRSVEKAKKYIVGEYKLNVELRVATDQHHSDVPSHNLAHGTLSIMTFDIPSFPGSLISCLCTWVISKGIRKY